MWYTCNKHVESFTEFAVIEEVDFIKANFKNKMNNTK